MTRRIADRPHDVWTRIDPCAVWALVGTFHDRTLANSYVYSVEGDWEYKVPPCKHTHLRWGVAALGYFVAVTGLVMFVTWFLLLASFLNNFSH